MCLWRPVRDPYFYPFLTISRSPRRKKDRKHERFEQDRHHKSSPSHQSDSKIDQEKPKSDDSSVEAAKKIQERMEEEMKKRRERMDTWRLKMQEGVEKSEDVEAERNEWTLDDENEDENIAVPMEEEENAGEQADGGNTGDAEKEKENGKVMEEEDVDPLDAFMVGVQKEVKKINTAFQKKSGTQMSTGE